MEDVCGDPNSSHVSEGYWTLEERALGQVTAVFVILYILVGLPWNALTSIVILKKKLIIQPTILLLLDLAVTDTLILVFVLLPIAITGISGEYIFGNTDEQRCKTCLLGIIPGILFLNSLFIVMLMSIDRFLYIYKPFVYERKATKLSTAIVIFGTFILSILLGVIFINGGEVRFYSEFIGCSFDLSVSEWPLIFVTVVVLLSLVVIVICNSWTVWIVQKNIRAVYGRSRSQSKSDGGDLAKKTIKTRQKKQLHMFRVFGGLLLSNLIAWVPFIILVLLLVIGIEHVPQFISTVFHILFLSQATVHPMLETALISDVRKPMKQLIICGLTKKKYLIDDSKDDGICLCCKGRDYNESACRSVWKLFDIALVHCDPVNHASHTEQMEEVVHSEYGVVKVN